MRAVNLIPKEDRRGGAGAPGRSGGAVYVLLGVLGVLVVAVGAYVLTSNTVKDRKAEVAKLQTQVTAAEARAAVLKPYRDFATLREQRLATVRSLAASRFDWDRALHELGVVLPGDAWLTSVTGSIAPGVTLESGSGGSGSTSSLRQDVNAPALELSGCTVSQSEVSRVLARLRRMHGVSRVALSQSEKTDQAAGTSGTTASPGTGTGNDCRNGSARFPQFSVVVFFVPLPGQTGAASPGGSAAPAAPAPSTQSPSQSSTTQTTSQPSTQTTSQPSTQTTSQSSTTPAKAAAP